ncbi:hypothetical protein R55210_AODCCCNP_01348 [Fructobacillus fructosus]|uniref:hypothetical protein n=1 Tax=Fructobacillus fructosus TaxID=1631 RepID=UPI002D8D559B|nr:hypothetical protein R55210_AODCCCNP_01348 [Fructobacillus fructosus]
MRINNKASRYLEATAQQYVSAEKPVYSVSPAVEVKYVWRDNRPTEEVSGYQLSFVQEGLPVFKVKFEDEPILPKFLSKVSFDQLTALEVRSNVYFKSSGLKEVK